MAIVLGPDPFLYLAACSDFPLGDYEMGVAGALRGAPLRTVKAETIDLEVPADAEIVIETEYTGEMDDEGPLNEYTGYQSESRKAPIWRVKAITMRRDPIMQLAFLGKPPNETCVLFRALEDGPLLKSLKGRFPLVTAIARPASLARDFWCIVQTDPKKRRPGNHSKLASCIDLHDAQAEIPRRCRRRHRHQQHWRSPVGHFDARRSCARHICCQ